MSRAPGYAAVTLILAGCCAYACSRGERVRAAVVRARWAWRCRGHPARPDDGDPLDRDEFCAFVGLVECWRHDVSTEGSRA